jgi:uncharacterized protein (DUF983 family)
MVVGETDAAPLPGGAASLFRVALLGRCPRCGRGPLFRGLLGIRETCPICGLDLRAQGFGTAETGDGPAVAAIFAVGALTMVAVFVVEFRLAPPLWLHALLWPALVLPLSVLTMRAAKAALIGLQWRHRRGAGGV